MSRTDLNFVTKLGVARQALTLAEKIPDIINLISDAEAVRAAARAKRISTPGINAWTRFVVDAERQAWKRIEAMRKAGELAPGGKGGDRKSNKIPELALDSLIERRPTARAAEWSLLSKLTEFQLDELERIANEEDRILARSELMKLAKAEISTTLKNKKTLSVDDFKLIQRARALAGDAVKINDDAEIRRGVIGIWVSAWVLIPHTDI
jgi:hypothetical protein